MFVVCLHDTQDKEPQIFFLDSTSSLRQAPDWLMSLPVSSLGSCYHLDYFKNTDVHMWNIFYVETEINL